MVKKVDLGLAGFRFESKLPLRCSKHGIIPTHCSQGTWDTCCVSQWQVIHFHFGRTAIISIEFAYPGVRGWPSVPTFSIYGRLLLEYVYTLPYINKSCNQETPGSRLPVRFKQCIWFANNIVLLKQVNTLGSNVVHFFPHRNILNHWHLFHKINK